MKKCFPGIGLCLLSIFVFSSCILYPKPHQEVFGQVIDEFNQNPIPNALVTLRATSYQTSTDSEGNFYLLVPLSEEEIEITAWASDFYIASKFVNPPASGLSLELRRLHSSDHEDYAWIDPTSDSSENACGNCHPMILPQWQNNAHGKSISNPRFYSFYNATDTAGNLINGSGYLLDFPGTTGNCASCHAPGAAVDSPLSSDMNQSRDQVTAGIHCDFCHKVDGVYLKPADKEVYSNAPGVTSMRTRRPPAGDQIFIGPYPDIHDPDTYNPLFSESQFCAGCHQFSFWGTEIYNSYGEWLESDFAQRGITCQDCHMPPSGETYFALPDQGGLVHPPESIPSHFQLGLNDREFMQSTLSMDTDMQVEDGKLTLRVILTNTGAGHHAPTDHPGRHIILVVRAQDENGNPVPQLDGPVIPAWAGDLAGTSGNVYAKVLQDARTGKYPVVDYWKPTLIQSDNRIPANEGHETIFIFDMNDKPVTVHVKVILRRLFQPIADTYNWDLGEIELFRINQILPMRIFR